MVITVKKIAIDIDNTICETSSFYGKLAIEYDRDVLHKKSNIDFTKVVPRSGDWNEEELLYYIENRLDLDENYIIKENDYIDYYSGVC